MSQSIKSNRISESTIARMAGNIIGSLLEHGYPLRNHDQTGYAESAVPVAVIIARQIAAEVERTAPPASSGTA